MARRIQTVRNLYPMARKISRLVDRFQTLRRPEYLLLKVTDFAHFTSAYRLYEKIRVKGRVTRRPRNKPKKL